MSLLLTLNIFHTFFSVSIVDIEQVNVCRVVYDKTSLAHGYRLSLPCENPHPLWSSFEQTCCKELGENHLDSAQKIKKTLAHITVSISRQREMSTLPFLNIIIMIY